MAAVCVCIVKSHFSQRHHKLATYCIAVGTQVARLGGHTGMPSQIGARPAQPQMFSGQLGTGLSFSHTAVDTEQNFNKASPTGLLVNSG